MRSLPARSAGGRSGLWRNGDFMKLWSAQAVSLMGSQVSVLAVPLTAILLHASTLQLGALVAAQYVPFLVIGLPAGVWVDRLPRRTILIAVEVSRACLLLSIPAAHAIGVLSLPLLYVVALLQGALAVFFDVASQSYLPSLVRDEQVVDANSKLQLSVSTSQLTGPGLGGILVQLVTAPVAILADAVSFACSASLLASIVRREPGRAAARTAGESGWRSEVLTGVRFVLRHELLRPIALVTGIGNFFGLLGMISAILVLYAVRDLHLTPARLGFALAIANVGALVGVAVNRHVIRRTGVGMAILLAALTRSVGIVILALAQPATAIAVLPVGLAVAWFSIAIYNVNQLSLRQKVTPNHLQGRMNATVRFLIWGPVPFGAVTGGALAGAIGVRWTLVVAAAGGAAGALPIAISRVPRLRTLPTAARRPESPADGGTTGEPVPELVSPSGEARR